MSTEDFNLNIRHTTNKLIINLSSTLIPAASDFATAKTKRTKHYSKHHPRATIYFATWLLISLFTIGSLLKPITAHRINHPHTTELHRLQRIVTRTPYVLIPHRINNVYSNYLRQLETSQHEQPGPNSTVQSDGNFLFDDDPTHQISTAPPRIIVCNTCSLSTQSPWELLRNAISLGPNDIICATETRSPQDKMRKIIHTFSHTIYSCFDQTRPHGSGCAIIIPTSLSSQVRRVWYHRGYVACLLLNAPTPLLIITLYLLHSSTQNLPFDLDDICNFLSPILIHANSAHWRIFAGGDFNFSPLSELLDAAHSDNLRPRRHQVHTLL
jgi:hypothetical protein